MNAIGHGSCPPKLICKNKGSIYAIVVFCVGHKSHYMDFEYVKEIKYFVKTIGTIISKC